MTPAGRAVQQHPQHQVPLTRAAQSLAGSGDSKSGPCDGHSRLVVAEYQAGRAKPVDTVLPSGPGVGVPADRQGWSLGPVPLGPCPSRWPVGHASRCLCSRVHSVSRREAGSGDGLVLPQRHPGPFSWRCARVCVRVCLLAHIGTRTHGTHTGTRCGHRPEVYRVCLRGRLGSRSQPQDGSQGPAHVSGRHLRPKPCPPQRWNATVRRQVAKVSLSRAWRQSP